MSQQHQVDLNKQIRLARVPTHKYPRQQTDIFQIKMVPPVPTDELKKGDIIVRNMYISIDATMRVWISGVTSYLPPVKPQDVMRAFCVGEVIYSNSKKFEAGNRVMGLFGWQKYAVVNQKQANLIPTNYPHPQHFLGVLGISGLTAYFGLYDIGKIKKGEKVVISAAAGAVGQIAVQLAKNQGCTVCGIAGSKQKCEYLTKIGCDSTINYKTQKIREKLSKIYPGGVDVYFDNVGGQMLDDILMHIRNDARVILCGLISTYGEKQIYRLKNYSRLIVKRGTMQGYLYFDYVKEFPKAIMFMQKLIKQGKLNTRIDMLNGLDECPKALRRLLMGENNGKVIVKVQSSSPTARL